MTGFLYVCFFIVVALLLTGLMLAGVWWLFEKRTQKYLVRPAMWFHMCPYAGKSSVATRWGSSCELCGAKEPSDQSNLT